MILREVSFKRKKNSKWESGISIEENNNGKDFIIDKDGNILMKIWTVRNGLNLIELDFLFKGDEQVNKKPI